MSLLEGPCSLFRASKQRTRSQALAAWLRVSARLGVK